MATHKGRWWSTRKALQCWRRLMANEPFTRELLWVMLNNDGWGLYTLVHRCCRRKLFHRKCKEMGFWH